MVGYTPYGDNVMYEGLRERGLLDWFLENLRMFPRMAVQITGGAQFDQAKAYALRVKRETPTQIVVIRKAIDDDIHWKMPADQQLQFLRSLAHGNELMVSWNNEPGTGDTSLAVMRDDLKYILPRLADDGIPVVAMNLSTGAVDGIEQSVPTGLIECATLIRDYGAYFGWHDYLNTQFWPDNTYTARYRYLTAHVPDLKIMITEAGFDSHSPHPELNGWRTHIPLWQTLFPGVDPETVYWTELVKSEMFYEPDNVPVLIYSLGADPARSVGRPFDYSDALQFMMLKNSYRRSVQLPQPYTVKITGMPKGILYRNIRSAIKATSEDSDIGDIRVGDIVTLVETDTPDWYKISDPVCGYAWLAGVTWNDYTPPPPPPPAVCVNLPEAHFQDVDTAMRFVQMLRDCADAIETEIES